MFLQDPFARPDSKTKKRSTDGAYVTRRRCLPDLFGAYQRAVYLSRAICYSRARNRLAQ
jgi:hypothetical protein